MSEKRNDFEGKVINILEHLKPKKTRLIKEKDKSRISQTAIGEGNIQVARVDGDLLIKQEGG